MERKTDGGKMRTRQKKGRERRAGVAIKSENRFFSKNKRQEKKGCYSNLNTCRGELVGMFVYLKHNCQVCPSIYIQYPGEAHKKDAREGTWHLKSKGAHNTLQ